MFFNEDEKIVLNSVAIDEKLDTVIDKINVSIMITEDESVQDMLEELLNKLNSMSNDEFNNVQKELPYTVSISIDDIENVEMY